MNVGEAMADVENNIKNNPSKYSSHYKEVAETLVAEVKRLRAELALLRKDWCDDDEAIKQQALRVLPKFEVEGDSVHVPRMGELAHMMADTALRYKEEGLAWMMAAQDKERELAAAKADRDSWRRVCEKETEAKHQAWAELAAAKAASVVPVEVMDIATGDEVFNWPGDFSNHRCIALVSQDEAKIFEAWLRDRIKERGEG